MLGTRRRSFGNIDGHVKGADDMVTLSQWTAGQFDPTLNWNDVAWVKERWGGKLILKGILDVEDAKHRRRHRRRRDRRLQPRRPPARRRACRPSARCRRSSMRSAQIEVYMDGGIRSGQDVLKAVRAGRARHLHRPGLP